MLWKSVKTFFSTSASITARLTVAYALSTILLLAIISTLSYWAMFNIVYKADKEFLLDQIDTLQESVTKKPNDVGFLKNQIVDIPEALADSIYHYYIRILDKHNKEIIFTPGMQHIIKKHQIVFLPALKQFRWMTINDKKYLILESEIKSGKNSWHVQAVLDVSYQYQLIKAYRYSEYRDQIILIFIASLLLAIVLGYFISKRGMRRLHDLTETTQKITATSLHNRIDPLLWPSELRDLGLSFNLMLNRIEKSFLRLTQFSDDLAHELRTPINNLMGETEIALTQKGLASEHQQVLVSNLEELQRISQMIENLLFLARSENPAIEIKKVMLNVQDEANLIKDYYQAIADDKNIEITVEGTAQLKAEPIMFRRMLNNLLSNAIKYTDKNGKVKVTIKDMNSNQIKIDIEDSGIGVAVEHQPNIFNRFYRADPNRSQKSGGMGLGLAIVKSIVDLHEGTVSMVSELGKGTLITITLPK